MRQNDTDGNELLSRFTSYVAVEKKKVILATCLIVVMAIMWVRVLGGKGPSAVRARSKAVETTKEETSGDLKMSFIELPNVSGRNDVLSRDFFVVDEEGFRDEAEMNVVLSNGSHGIAKLIAAKLKLEVIELGKNRQAFINGKLLSEGDKLVVSGETRKYECEIADIKADTVLVKCEDAEITLKLAQDIDVTD